MLWPSEPLQLQLQQQTTINKLPIKKYINNCLPDGWTYNKTIGQPKNLAKALDGYLMYYIFLWYIWRNLLGVNKAARAIRCSIHKHTYIEVRDNRMTFVLRHGVYRSWEYDIFSNTLYTPAPAISDYCHVLSLLSTLTSQVTSSGTFRLEFETQWSQSDLYGVFFSNRAELFYF